MKKATSFLRKLKNFKNANYIQQRERLKMLTVPFSQKVNEVKVCDQENEETQCKDQLRDILKDLLKGYESKQPSTNDKCSTEPKSVNQKRLIIDLMDAQRFLKQVFAALKVPKSAINHIVDSMLAADYFGHGCMGLHGLPSKINEIICDAIDVNASPMVLRESKALALVSGRNAPGPVVGSYCMDMAVVKAINEGLGWVAARDSNCIGMASYYACQALEYGAIGLCMSNSPPCMVPAGGLIGILGENPLACAAGAELNQLIVDFGMAAVGMQQIEMDYCNGDVTCIPVNLAYGRNGVPTASAAEALRAQRIRPFMPEHKGAGLAIMVDMLCGVLTGANYSTMIPHYNAPKSKSQPAGLGQIFIAIDPLHFNTKFDERLSDFLDDLRNAWPMKNEEPTFAPGDAELEHMNQVDADGGIQVSQCQVDLLKSLAEEFKLKPIHIIQK